MKEITKALKFELQKTHAGINTKVFSWDSIYDTEEELVSDLFHKKIFTDEDGVPMHMWCRGYDFIKGFRKYYRQHGSLTEKQMRQLKRLAAEIAYRIYCD